MSATQASEIPRHVLDAARADSRSPIVADYFGCERERLGVPAGAGPADWPDALWSIYSALREAQAPGSTAPLARHRYARSILGALLDGRERARILRIRDPQNQANAVVEVLERMARS